VVGTQGDATYLVVENDGSLASYGVNAVCTHLGCVVPWNAAENKFACPCHGSQYNNQGKVVRGPAPLVSTRPEGLATLLVHPGCSICRVLWFLLLLDAR